MEGTEKAPLAVNESDEDLSSDDEEEVQQVNPPVAAAPDPAAAAAAPPSKPEAPLLTLLRSSKKIVGGISMVKKGPDGKPLLVNGKKKYGKGDQLLLLESLVELGETALYHRTVAKEPPVKALFDGLRVSKGDTKLWTKNFVAENLHKIILLLKRSDQKYGNRSARSNSNAPAALQKLRTYLGKLEEVLKKDLAKATLQSTAQSKRGGRKKTVIGAQDGTWVQEGLLPFNPDRLEQEKCPACMHGLLVRVDSTEKAAANRAMLKKYREEMAAFTGLGKSEQAKTKKPELDPEWCDDLLACMCCVMDCRNRMDGAGCFECTNSAARGDRPAIVTNPATNMGVCQCNACQCLCNVVFRRKDRTQLALQIAEKRREEKGAPQGEDFGGMCHFVD